jgi:hypothetical protein
MFMDPSYVIEAPQDGWPNITSETMKDLGKTEEVVALLRHLPYIGDRGPYTNLPEALPGSTFKDWKYNMEKWNTGETGPWGDLLMTEGLEGRFGGKIPSYCVGLVTSGRMFGNDERDAILLDTRSGVVYWMDCPEEIRDAAIPQPSFLVYPLEGETEETVTTREGEIADENEEADPDAQSDEDEDDDELSDEDEDLTIQWGPCWPVRHFFEMLKNQYRQLNFLPKDEYHVVEIWTNTNHALFEKSYLEMLQAIYRKHGWPDLSRYRKEECLAEIKRETDEKHPDMNGYYFH